MGRKRGRKDFLTGTTTAKKWKKKKILKPLKETVCFFCDKTKNNEKGEHWDYQTVGK